MNALQTLTKVDPQVVLARYIGEERTQDIAQSYGVSRVALNTWLRKVAEEEWKDAQVARGIERKEKAEDALDAATDMFQVNKAQAQLKAAQWDLERTYRRVYGDRAELVTVPQIEIRIGIDRGDSAPNTITIPAETRIRTEEERIIEGVIEAPQRRLPPGAENPPPPSSSPKESTKPELRDFLKTLRKKSKP